MVGVQVSLHPSPPALLCSQNCPVVIHTSLYVIMPSLGSQHETSNRSPTPEHLPQCPLQAPCAVITPFLSTGMGSKWQLQFLSFTYCVYDVSTWVRGQLLEVSSSLLPWLQGTELRPTGFLGKQTTAAVSVLCNTKSIAFPKVWGILGWGFVVLRWKGNETVEIKLKIGSFFS